MQYQLNFQNNSKITKPSKVTLNTVFQYIEEQETLEFIQKIKRPSNKTIRLAKDLAKQHAPLMLDHNDTVRSILGTKISNERIQKVKPFKAILFKKVISDVTYLNGRYIVKTRKVRR